MTQLLSKFKFRLRCVKGKKLSAKIIILQIINNISCKNYLYENLDRTRLQIVMDIFRRLGNGLSKLSVNKKGSASKSKSKTRAYRAKSDGLTYSSPFGASFRHDHDVGSISFVSPETIVIRSHEDSSEDSEDSDSSFDKPFLDQASSKDLGDRSHPTKSNFRIYRRLVHARSGMVPESESQLEKVRSHVLNRLYACQVRLSRLVLKSFNF